jgi:hypothetical protein
MKRALLMAIVFGVLVMPASAWAARLYLSPVAGVVCEGKTYLVDIRLDSPDEYINTVQLEMGWDPARIQITDTNFTGSLFKVWPFADVDNIVGYSKAIGGLMTPGYKGSGGLVFRPTIQVLGTGPATLTILPSSDVLLNDGYGTSASVTFDSLNVNVVPIGDPACATPTPTPAPTAPPGPTGIPGTPGPTPTPFVCPDVPTCSLPEEGAVYPCDFIETCPGYQDTVTQGFVTDATLQCPIRYDCIGGVPAVTPTTSPIPLVVESVIERFLPGPVAQSATQVLYEVRPGAAAIAALTVIGAAMAGLGALLQLRSIVGSLADMASMLWYSLIGLSRLNPKKSRIWGTVYDSYTKKPIPLVVVELLGADNRLLERRITDRDGRYGFLASAASLHEGLRQVQLRASRRGYRFPSTALQAVQEEFYKDPYRGGIIPVNQEHLVGHDIPMDPEIIPNIKPHKPVRMAIAAWVASLADASFRIGIVMAPVNYILMPNTLNAVMVGIVLATAILRQLGFKVRPYGVIADANTGLAMPFAFVTLHNHQGQRVGYAVSDEYGRYFLQSEQGMHELTVATPAQTQPNRKSTQVIVAPDGWVRKKIVL